MIGTAVTQEQERRKQLIRELKAARLEEDEARRDLELVQSWNREQSLCLAVRLHGLRLIDASLFREPQRAMPRARVLLRAARWAAEDPASMLDLLQDPSLQASLQQGIGGTGGSASDMEAGIDPDPVHWKAVAQRTERERELLRLCSAESSRERMVVRVGRWSGENRLAMLLLLQDPPLQAFLRQAIEAAVTQGLPAIEGHVAELVEAVAPGGDR